MTSFRRNRPEAVYLYGDPSTPNLDVERLCEFLSGFLPSWKIEGAGEFLKQHRKTENLSDRAIALASTKVRNITSRNLDFEPMSVEIEFEMRLLAEPSKNVHGILYDAVGLFTIYQSELSANDPEGSSLHIAFTNRLFGTFEDGRYHARAILCGNPSIISTTGIVHAPARAKEYYLARQLGGGLVGEDLAGPHVKLNDERISRVMEGYVLQALMFNMTGEPFCSDPECRLYNAHWQSEVIKNQIERPKICEHHLTLLNDLQDA